MAVSTECLDGGAAAYSVVHIVLYGFAAVLLLTGIVHAVIPRRRPPPFSAVYFRMFWSSHLVLGAVGYALEGAARQLHTDAGVHLPGLVLASRLVVVLAMDPLIGVFFCIGEGLLPDSSRLWTVLWYSSAVFVVTSLVAVGVTTVFGVGDFDTFTTVLGVVYLCVEVVWIAAARRRPTPAGVAKTVSGAVILAALVQLAVLEPRCGERGVSDCFSSCPLGPHGHRTLLAGVLAGAYVVLAAAQGVEPDAMVAPAFFAFLGLEGDAQH